MKVVFLGTPKYVEPIIKSLDENFDLVKIIRSPSDSFDSLESFEPDLFIVASFGKIIPENILKIAKLGAINIHPSKLPKYRGPSPIQNQILDGVKDSAISYILMDSEMDHGPILKQVPFEISEKDSFGSLCEKMFAESAKYLPEVISGFADGSIKPKEQNHNESSVTKLVEKQDGYFEIDNPPTQEDLDKKIRAYYPWPGAWTKWSPSAKASEDEKGKIVKFLPNLKPTTYNPSPFLVQMEGKSATDLKSFLNGYPDFPVRF